MNEDNSLAHEGGEDKSDETVRVIGSDGRQLGFMLLSDARELATRDRAALVKVTAVASPAGPSLC